MSVVDLGMFRRDREAADADTLVVERTQSPDNPNVSYYEIHGVSYAVVQSEIAGLIAEVESFGSGGSGLFTVPKRKSDGRYAAVGRIEAFVDDV